MPLLCAFTTSLPLPTHRHNHHSHHSHHYHHHRHRYHHSTNIISATTPSLSAPHVLIIGAGAAGHLAAITCANRTNHLAQITLLESTSKVLQKVRISGGGRCNVTSATNANEPHLFASNYPRGSREILSPLSVFGTNEICDFFEREGVPLKVEHDGKVFPVSNDSDTVVRALQTAAKRAHVQLSLKCRVVNVVRSADMYRVDIANGHSMYAHFVLVATGGALRPHSWAEQLGHVIIPTVPSLFTFGISDDRLVGLAGVSVPDCTVQLVRHDVQDKGHGRRRKRHDSQLCQRGPVLITHWGLSGPAILALSAFGARVLHETKYHMTCCVDWMPHLSLQEKRQVLYEARLRHAMKNVSTVSPCGNAFPRRLWHALAVSIVGITGTEKWKTVSNNIIDKFAHVLHSCKFEVSSKGAFKEEFVTAGGVALSGVNMKTFESKHSPGLFFAGETLDVDGKTGGFNLGFAWSSGYVAGNAIAENILSQQATQ